MKQNIGKISPLIIKKIYRLFRYKNEYPKMIREMKFSRQQNASIEQNFSRQEQKLIVFVVPGANPFTGKDTVSGGVISIVSICEETESLREIHGAATFMCTLDEDALLLKHENFENHTLVYRFNQLRSHFSQVKEILIHIPEFMVQLFLERLSVADRKFLKKLDNVHINIMNQNIRLMPAPEQLETLRSVADELSITTAHQKYCTPHYREYFKIPIHKLSVWISPEQYRKPAWKEKENLLVVSPDAHPEKEMILEKLRQVPGLKVQIIQNLTYDQYKELIARAKWSLTFGEGLDGYLIEPVFSGAIGFAVFNEQFFTPDFGALQTVYKDIDELKQRIINDIARFDLTEEGRTYQQQQYDLCALYYSKAQYKKNIALFYQRAYTYA